MNKRILSLFFLISVIFASNLSAVTLAQPEKDLQVGDYAEYTISAAFITFANNSWISEGAGNFMEGTFKWVVTKSSGTDITLDLDLKISSMDYEATVIVKNRMGYFANGSKWGYIPLWVNSAQMQVGDSIDVSGTSNTGGNYSGLSTGRVESISELQETVKGWQECCYITSDTQPKILGGSVTLIPYYHYDKDSGILVKMGEDPIWSFFDNFSISGSMTLKSTNIDLGPQSLSFILIYLVQSWPIIALGSVFIVGFVVHQKLTRRSKRKKTNR